LSAKINTTPDYPKQPPALEGSGRVVKNLEASWWVVHDAGNFEEAHLRAINRGDDADTTGAICGQLAGAFWGESGISQSLRSGENRHARGGSVGTSRALTELGWDGHSQFRGSANEALEMESSGLPTSTDRSSVLTDSPDRCKYDLIRGRMDHEDVLITNRLNWLITSQSFLFAAYATLFRSGGAQQVVGAEVPLLVRLIPLIGLLSGILVYTAILAGVVALMHNRGLLRTHLRAVLSRDPDFPAVHGRRPMAWLALLAPVFLPLVLVGAWITLLLQK
jgi:hypothetical protein